MATTTEIAAIQELITSALIAGNDTRALRATLTRLEQEQAEAEAAAQALAAAGRAEAEAAREARIAEIASRHAEDAQARLRDLESRIALPPAPPALLKDTRP